MKSKQLLRMMKTSVSSNSNFTQTKNAYPNKNLTFKMQFP